MRGWRGNEEYEIGNGQLAIGNRAMSKCENECSCFYTDSNDNDSDFYKHDKLQNRMWLLN